MVPILFIMNSIARRSAAKLQNEMKSNGTELCRTCLRSTDLIDIFDDKRSVKKRTEELKLTTGLEINYNDGLSQKICSQCVKLMKMALKFRFSSRKAQRSLLKMKKENCVKLEKNNISKDGGDNEGVDDYGYNCFEDDFQNDYEYKHITTNRVKKALQKTKILKKKRIKLPLSTSYKCNTCNKEFLMKATYRAHMRFHTNYCVCESCGKRCRNHNQLQEHKRARHGLGKIHKCAYCEYSSATKEALTIHERRHTGERPYICDHCGASFHRRSTLVQHIAIHLPEKNFQCDMCPKRLKSKKFLQIHKHNAHTGKRYAYLCPICEHRFEKPNKVRAHTRRVHGVPDEQHGAIIRIQL
ncbi:unnamed protein product [Leptosia nina]|uniref:Uncharacterized protein n=1 Tax=Leptosia nina TaxID=320188 RepID=A0AAV1K2Y1_9NEOP